MILEHKEEAQKRSGKLCSRSMKEIITRAFDKNQTTELDFNLKEKILDGLNFYLNEEIDERKALSVPTEKIVIVGATETKSTLLEEGTNTAGEIIIEISMVLQYK